MAISILSSKGQTTIPKVIREILRTEPNDRIAYTPLKDGTVKIQAIRNSVKSIKGIFQDKKRVPISLKQMERAIADARRHRFQK